MPRPLLHVLQIGFFNDPEARAPEKLLKAWPTLVDVAEAASLAGARVSVMQASAHSQQLERNGVHYYFLPFGDAAPRLDEALAPQGRSSPACELLRRLLPDVFHVHGLDFPRHVLWLAASGCGAPILLQDHASRPPRIWRRTAWRRGNSVAAGIAFCAAAQARPFVKAGLLDAETRLYEIPESTCRFAPGARDEARRITGVAGNPAVLWVGHLDVNKDPLTVLEGVGAAVRALPGLRLYCCFAGAPLLRAVQDRIGADPQLRGRVELLGRVPHERIEWLMRAADLFVLGSHREGSGYSLIEALACGLPPVVTDIPSFRSLTGAGAVGYLWPRGDARALGEALCAAAQNLSPETRGAARAHFDRELSFEALGRKLTGMYADVLSRGPDAMLPPRPRGPVVAASSH
ncbi:MAG: glycosyltransferase family 4 protein [Steroidobacteraceae bacterium]